MSDRDALLAAILAAPDDDLPRLVYADWLDENAASLPPPDRATAADRAAFIRTQVEAARAEPHSPDARAAQARADQLLKPNRYAWTRHIFDRVVDASFARGFVEHVTFDALRFPDRIDAVCDAEPIRSVRVARSGSADVWLPLEPVLEAPRLRQLAALDLSPARLTMSLEYDALAASPHLGGLQELSLSGNPVPPRWLTDFLAGPRLPALTGLNLSGIPHLGPALAAGLDRAGHRAFTRLDLSGVVFRSADLKRALECPSLADVEELRLGWESGHGSGPLRLLDLGWVIPWRRLRVLDLAGHDLGPEGVREIARNPEAANLRWLGLARNGLGASGVAELVAARHLNPYYLDLRDNGLSDRDLAVLRRRFPDAEIVK